MRSIKITKVKHYFIEQMKELVEEEEELLRHKRQHSCRTSMLSTAKKDGFSDRYLSAASGSAGGGYPRPPPERWAL